MAQMPPVLLCLISSLVGAWGGFLGVPAVAPQVRHPPPKISPAAQMASSTAQQATHGAGLRSVDGSLGSASRPNAWKTAEASVTATLAKMHQDVALLRSPSSVLSFNALLDELEAAKPLPASFSRSSLLGDWTLQYAETLPSTLRKEALRHIGDGTIKGMSVLLSVKDDGNMETKAAISLLDGQEIVVTNQQEEGQAMEVKYISDTLLVLQKDSEAGQSDAFGELLEANKISQPKTEVWRKLEQPSGVPLVAVGSLSCFGLPLVLTEQDGTHGRAPAVARTDETEVGLSESWMENLVRPAAKVSLVALLLAVFAAVAAGRRWRRGIAVSDGCVACDLAEIELKDAPKKLALAALVGEVAVDEKALKEAEQHAALLVWAAKKTAQEGMPQAADAQARADEALAKVRALKEGGSAAAAAAPAPAPAAAAVTIDKTLHSEPVMVEDIALLKEIAEQEKKVQLLKWAAIATEQKGMRQAGKQKKKAEQAVRELEKLKKQLAEGGKATSSVFAKVGAFFGRIGTLVGR